ncbi:MAG: sporulation protein YunB [Ruminococcus sp.]|nr:sporulation protein YunB [Ruminococcus sp.]
MSAKRPSFRCRLSYIALFVILLLAGLLLIIHHSVREHISELCSCKCAEAVNGMICEVISGLGVQSCPFYTLEYDSEGKISSAQADTAALNDVQNRIRSELNSRLAEAEYNSVTVTLGDLTDIEFLSGRGAELTFGFQQTGRVDTETRTHFESAGINQTRFRASILVTVSFKVLLPGGSESIDVTDEYVLTDTLIVGEVPQMYPIPGTVG